MLRKAAPSPVPNRPIPWMDRMPMASASEASRVPSPRHPHGGFKLFSSRPPSRESGERLLWRGTGIMRDTLHHLRAQHLIWAMAAIIYERIGPRFAQPLPIMRLLGEPLSTGARHEHEAL